MILINFQAMVAGIVMAVVLAGSVVILYFEERQKIRGFFAALSLVSVIVIILMVNESKVNSALGWSANFSDLGENHLVKYETYSEELKVGLFSDQEGKHKGDRRLVKNIPSDLKPGELFVIREGKVFTYKTKLVVPAKPSN
jgi:hypothetical protein